MVWVEESGFSMVMSIVEWSRRRVADDSPEGSTISKNFKSDSPYLLHAGYVRESMLRLTSSRPKIQDPRSAMSNA